LIYSATISFLFVYSAVRTARFRHFGASFSDGSLFFRQAILEEVHKPPRQTPFFLSFYRAARRA